MFTNHPILDIFNYICAQNAQCWARITKSNMEIQRYNRLKAEDTEGLSRCVLARRENFVVAIGRVMEPCKYWESMWMIIFVR